MILDTLITKWQEAKAAEKEATERRREIEDDLVTMLKIDTAKEGTQTFGVLKVTPRLDRKVDAQKVQELAAEHGIEAMLSSLFRWEPSLNVSVWKATDERITNALAPAITVKPGRASFSITEKKEK